MWLTLHFFCWRYQQISATNPLGETESQTTLSKCCLHTIQPLETNNQQEVDAFQYSFLPCTVSDRNMLNARHCHSWFLGIVQVASVLDLPASPVYLLLLIRPFLWVASLGPNTASNILRRTFSATDPDPERDSCWVYQSWHVFFFK